MLKNLCFMLFMVGCARSSEEVLPAAGESNPPRVVGTPAPTPERPVKFCDVAKTEKIKDCTIYFLECEDGSEELAASCEIHPIGYVTNPPRPVSLLEMEFGK